MAKTFLKRIIALFLLISLTFGNVAFVGKTYATEFFSNLFGGNNGNDNTWNGNIEFETYFEKNNQRSMSVISDVNSNDTEINFELNVSESGYLKDATVEIFSSGENELNFKISDKRKTIEEVNISEFENIESVSTQGGESLNLGSEIQVLSIGGQEIPLNTGLTLDMLEEENADGEIQTDDSISLIMDEESSEVQEEKLNEEENNSQPLIIDLSTPSDDNIEAEALENNTINNEENATNDDENIETNEEETDVQKVVKESSILDEYENYIDTIESNKISLKQIGSKSNVKISIPIEYVNEDFIDENKLYSKAIVRFSGKYIDDDGKEQEISKEQEINVGWRSLREINVSQEITKYINFGSGVIIQTKIKLDNTIEDTQHIELSMDDNYLPVKETKLNVQVPKYMDKEVSGVMVSTSKLDATTGNSAENLEFNDSNWNYNSETGEIEILVKNEKKTVEEKLDDKEIMEEGEQKEKIYNIPGEDEYIVTYTYTDVDVPEEGTQIESNIKASQEFYSAFVFDEVKNMTLEASSEIDLQNVTTSTIELGEQVELKKSIGELISVENSNETESISKKYGYLNYKNEEKIEKEIAINDIINISYNDIIENIKINDGKVVYATENPDGENTQEETNDVYYKRIEISKSNFESILGEDGYININDSNGATIATINKEKFSNEDDVVQINLENQRKIELVTSKPINAGILAIKKVRAIRENTITREKFVDISKIKFEENVSAKYQYVNTDTNIKTIGSEVRFDNTKTDADLSINKDNFATLADNKNVEFTIALNNDSELSDIYGNSHFEIEFPAYITNVELGDVNLIDASGLEIESAKVEDRVIKIDVKGVQKDANVGNFSNGTNIVLYADIDVHDYTPATNGIIKLVYQNEEATAYGDRPSSEDEQKYGNIGVDCNTEIKYSAPTGLVTVNDVSNYVEGKFITSVRQGLKEDLIAVHSDERAATMGLTLINNTGNKVSNISIVGNFPQEGLVDPITGDSLDITINTELVSKIEGSSANNSQFKVYYSTQSNVDGDLQKEENGWTEQAGNLGDLKSYLIVPEDSNYEMQPCEVIRFAYSFKIPKDLGRYENIAGVYKAEYINHSEIGDIKEISCPDIVRLTTGEGPEISVEISTDKEELFEGKEFKESVVVSNIGREKANNVLLKLSNLSLTEYKGFNTEKEDRVIFESEDTKKELLFKIPYIDIREKIEIEVNFVVNTLNTTNTGNDIEINIEATADDLGQTIKKKAGKISISHADIDIEELFERNDRELFYCNEEITTQTEVLNRKNEIINNVVITKKISNDLEYVSSELVVKTDIDEHLGSGEYNAETGEIKFTINTLETGKTYLFETKFKTKDLPSNYDLATCTIDAKAEYDGNVFEANRVEIKVAKIKLAIRQLTEEKNEYISVGDTVNYKFEVENIGLISAKSVNFEDDLPEGMGIRSATYTFDGSEYFKAEVVDSTASFKFSLEPEERVMVDIDARAKTTQGSIEKTVVNSGTIYGTNVDETSSEKVTHVIKANEKYYDEIEYADDAVEEDSEYPGLLTSNNRISGKIWFDSNENGVIDGDENTSEDIRKTNISLLNMETGKIVKTIKAGSIGEYRFTGIEKGKYKVVFEYDTIKYAITTYKKSGASESSNSDAYAGKVSKNGKVINVAITDEINVENTNIDGINLGLIAAEKFDLEVSMGITKISIQSGDKVKTNNYDNSNFAKEEISAKEVKGSKVIIEYSINVKNAGDIEGYVKKLVDYVPQDMEFNSSYNGNDRWYTSKDGNIYSSSLENVEIKPGETKTLKLVLTKNMTEENTGNVSNQVEIYEDYNIYGISDIDSKPGNKVQKEDDLAIADVLVLIKTGAEYLYTSVFIIILTISIPVGMVIYNKIPKEKGTSWHKKKEKKTGKSYR